MFKISLLSSTSGKTYGSADAGTSGHSKRSKQQAADAPAAAESTTVSSTLEPRDWTQQAADVTDNLLDASKYKSLAVYAEVKLAEALDKAAKVQADTVNEDGEVLPNSLKTAVCFQLLGELAEVCGPFSKPLIAVRDQLLPAVYSSYAAAQATRPLQFDQMPWFSVAAHLQRDNTTLLAQQEAFKRELAAHQAQMSAVEQQLLTFKAAIDAGEAAVAALTATNASLIAARDAAVDDAEAAAEEEKRLANEVARLKDALLEVQGQLDISKDNAAQDKEEWLANLAVLKKQLIIEQQEKEAAVSMVAIRMTTEAELQDWQDRCAEAELKLEEAEQRLKAAASLASQQHTLTPRPQWGPDQDLADKCTSTAETVSQLQQRHLETITALQRQVTLAQALSQPDPAPKPWTLSLRTETLNYFITEGALNPSDTIDREGSLGDLDGGNPGRKPQLFAEGLGLGSDVPRLLRSDQPVEIQECDLDTLQQQIRDIWSGKISFVLQHGQCSLHEYIYHHFAAAAASGSSSGDSTTSTSAAAAAAGYSFYHACCSHRSQSVLVDTIWQILTGNLPESILAQQQQQVAAVGQLLDDLLARSAAAAASGGGGDESETKQPGVSQSDISSALRFLYPLKPQEQITDLTACIAAACGINSSSSSRRNTGGKSSSDCCLTEACLQQLATAMQSAAKGYLVISFDDTSVSSNAGSSGTAQQDEQLDSSAGEANAEAGVATPVASEPAAAAAAAKVVECILHQHLQAVLSFTQEVMQRVQDLLLPRGDRGSNDGSSSGGSSSGGSSGKPLDAAWQGVTEYLQQVLSQASSSSSDAGNSRGSRGKGSFRSRTGAHEDLPLLAAAAAAATSVQRNDSDAARGLGKGITNSTSALSSTFAELKRWLQLAQQVDHADRQHSQQGIDAAALVQCLQREVLLQPVTCLTDTAAASQWCKTSHRNNL